jgi:hypothetical protein
MEGSLIHITTFGNDPEVWSGIPDASTDTPIVPIGDAER